MDGFAPIDPNTLEEHWVDLTPPSPEDAAEKVRRAFDAGADLNLNPPAADIQPGEEEGRKRRKRRVVGGKAAGSEAMGAMAVAGFSILMTFVVGKWAAPTEEEANALATPIGNILARRIDLASKLGQDADDTLLLLMALMSYGARVAPEAVDRSRDAWQRSRDRKPTVVPPRPVAVPIRPDDFGGTRGVPDGEDVGESAPLSTTRSPLDVIAAVGERQLRGLGIDSPAHS